MKALTPQDPKWLGRNRTIAVIGRGGMGRVLLGRTPTGRLVAIKQIHPHLAGDPQFRDRFAREVDACRQLTGAYTASVIDSDTESDNPWLATEYINGPDLKTVIDECGPLSLGGLRLLATGLASALLEIHRAGLLHRDLKPGNVLLTGEGPRIIDFGIARALDSEALTATGTVLGSPAYMSPEQAEGRPLTAAADVYSVGAILAMAATGSSPFPGVSTPQVLYSVIHSAPKTEGVPLALRELVDACLSKDPARRPTAEQLLDGASRIQPEPVWPAAVTTRIDAHRADSDWWVQTSERESRLEEEVEQAKSNRRRMLKRVAAAAATLVVLGAGMFGVHEMSLQDGHSQPMTDPSLTVTTMELQQLDTCKVLDLVTPKLGTRNKAPSVGYSGCSVWVTDEDNHSISVELENFTSADEVEQNTEPTGQTAGWVPILKSRYGGGCDRSVLTQSGGHSALKVSTYAPQGPANCSMADKAITAVVQQLTVYVPQLKLAQNSILRVDPCSLLDPTLAGGLAGDPARRGRGAGDCFYEGSTGTVEVTLQDVSRVDNDNKRYQAVQIGQTTAYIEKLWLNASNGNCEVVYQPRLTTGDNAEIVRTRISDWGTADTGACDQAKKLMADVLPRLPK
ncbi:serine/threonine protein kinase [Nocardia yunnanensis]|uniref:Serine/threonine protein kinase n=1 Tax=Nocardia yunnanensis TaxID=2382165 RepID=A0A386ZGF1_9NOCA|nr:serine/threonine-protein kinase [Nocardia yunnanensis]AYF76598.1 serine/threonine protein kinase [Nocardia yunnanensis]